MSWPKSITAFALMWTAPLILAQVPPAQVPPPQNGATANLSPRQIAEKRAAEWEALAKTLDSRIARMLPCDPRAKDAITEVSRASEARMAALSELVKMAITQTKSDIDRVRLALTAEDESLRDAETEHLDMDQERVAVEAQLSDLAESASTQTGLDDARKKLAGISASVTRRTNIAADQIERRATLDIALRDMQAALQIRQTTLANEQAALNAEASRWNDYYNARLARAQMECTVTGAPARKKKP